MDPKTYLKGCLRTESPASGIQLFSQEERLLHAAMGLCTEAGEFQDQLKRHFFYGTPLDFTNVEEELGDLLWYVSIGLDAIGSDYETCMAQNNAEQRKASRQVPRQVRQDAGH